MEERRKKIDRYRTLLAYQKSERAFAMAVYFVEHFLNRAHNRTADQMQHAARSGNQNIVEGYSDAEGTTSTEHRLTVIAKGCLEELKEDFRDYLQVFSLQIWDANHEKHINTLRLCQTSSR